MLLIRAWQDGCVKFRTCKSQHSRCNASRTRNYAAYRCIILATRKCIVKAMTNFLQCRMGRRWDVDRLFRLLCLCPQALSARYTCMPSHSIHCTHTPSNFSLPAHQIPLFSRVAGAIVHHVIELCAEVIKLSTVPKRSPLHVDTHAADITCHQVDVLHFLHVTDVCSCAW